VDGFGEPLEIAPGDPRLSDGFHALEDGRRRWTRGRARLPESLFGGRRDGGLLSLAMGATQCPRRRAPEAAAAACAS
jgi:hypothetical protein